MSIKNNKNIDMIDTLINDCVKIDIDVSHDDFIKKISDYLHISSFNEQLLSSEIKICDKVFRLPPNAYYDNYEFNYCDENEQNKINNNEQYKIQEINEFYKKYEFLRVYCDNFNYID